MKAYSRQFISSPFKKNIIFIVFLLMILNCFCEKMKRKNKSKKVEWLRGLTAPSDFSGIFTDGRAPFGTPLFFINYEYKIFS